MNREEARQEIRQQWRRVIMGISSGKAKRSVNGEPSYICPICQHGTNGDGLTVNPRSTDGNGLKCFGCGFSGDIIDLYQQVANVGYTEAVNILGDHLGLSIDSYQNPAERKNDRASAPERAFLVVPNTETRPVEKTAQTATGGPTAAKPDYSEYYRACQNRLNSPEAISYLQARGISPATALAYGLGFDPSADPAGNPGGVGVSRHPCPRIIMPTSPAHYVGRSIDPNTQKQYAKMNPKGASPAIFNAEALTDQNIQELFVVEGIFDALSLLEVGADAIALNSTSNVDSLIKALERHRTPATLVLCLDNDGRQSTADALQKLRDGLTRLNISHVPGDICCGKKDPNEALTADRDAFTDAIEAARHEAAAKPDNIGYYLDNLMTADIERFRSSCLTGYPNLDAKCGGLYGGLYVVAAISSLGKTTFCQQMADQIAAAGNDVLFFSLEQSRLELASKSIARVTAQKDMKTAVTSLSIRKGYLPSQVLEAAAAYKDSVGDRLSVIEGNFACDTAYIANYVRQYVRRNNRRPVVFIDYLQILQPSERGKQSTKEMIDSTVTELKRLSRELELTIFVVSSVNRANYLTPIDFESLKESGSVEYTADVIWGLQLQCLSEDLFDKSQSIKAKRERVKEAKAEMPRKIELSCLKNRYGVASFSCFFDYYPANDLFVPVDAAAADLSGSAPKKAGRKLPKE